MIWRRTVLLIAIACFGVSVFGSRVRADTTATTGITVTTEDVGTLAVTFDGAPEGYIFRNALGETSLSVSAISGDTATATIRIEVTDTRNDAERVPFRIQLQADDLTSTDNAPGLGRPFVLSASTMSIIQIGDEPASSGQTLDFSRVVYDSGETPEPGEITLDVVLQLSVPPSSFALTYQSTFGLQILTGVDEP